MSRRNIYMLIAVLLLCIAAPIASVWIDFGGGTDDAACEVIEMISGSNTPAIEMEAVGYEPTDATEPWLFVLQVVIGVVIFVAAVVALRRYALKS